MPTLHRKTVTSRLDAFAARFAIPGRNSNGSNVNVGQPEVQDARRQVPTLHNGAVKEYIELPTW